MTDWPGLVETQTDPEAPIDSDLMKGLWKGPIAIAEGAEGAPRIVGNAIARDFTGFYLPPLAVTAADTATSEVGLGEVLGTASTTGTSFVTAVTYRVRSYSGTMRFRCRHAPGDSQSEVRLVKNGTTVQTFTTSTTATQRSVDAAVSVGDVFTWRHRRVNGAGPSVVDELRVNASDAYVATPAWVPSSVLRDAP